MAPLTYKVEILSGKQIGGVYPFLVACYDNFLVQELHKSAATVSQNGTATWNESFSLDVSDTYESIKAEGRPEPKYLTFFIFDTAFQHLPSLGSAGVRLATVQQNGVAKGDFPVVHGKGSLALIVTQEEEEDESFLHSKTAKLAAAVGGTAAAAGLGYAAMNFMNKKKKENTAPSNSEEEDHTAQNDQDEDAQALAEAQKAEIRAQQPHLAAQQPDAYPQQNAPAQQAQQGQQRYVDHAYPNVASYPGRDAPYGAPRPAPQGFDAPMERHQNESFERHDDEDGSSVEVDHNYPNRQQPYQQ